MRVEGERAHVASDIGALYALPCQCVPPYTGCQSKDLSSKHQEPKQKYVSEETYSVQPSVHYPACHGIPADISAGLVSGSGKFASIFDVRGATDTRVTSLAELHNR